MKDVIIHPFELNVMSKAYQHQAFPMGIIQAHIKNYELWLCNKYINCMCFLKNNEKTFYFQDYFWERNDEGLSEFTINFKSDILESNVRNNISDGFQDYLCDRDNDALTGLTMNFEPKILEYNALDIISQNKSMISHGYYVTGKYNEFYIPQKYPYQKHNFVHNYIILGYDDRSKTFKSAGYLENKKYSFFDIRYNDFLESIKKTRESWLKITYVRVNDDYTPKIDIDTIKNRLENYLNSVSDEYDANQNGIFGVSVWKEFVKYISTNESHLDLRASRCYLEHKSIMQLRMKLLYEHGYFNDIHLLNSYKNVVKNAQLVHTLFLKYNMCKNKRILDGICEYATKMNEQDEELMNFLFACIAKKLLT